MPRSEKPATALDAATIFQSVGDVLYEWHLANDTIRWGDNACAVLGVTNAASIARGRAYASLIDPASEHTRHDAVMNSGATDNGQGVLFQAKYCLRPDREHPAIWVEDVGRWFAGPDGRPARAHGVVRIINERHAQEQQLTYLSRYDGLTGEMNRWNLTEVLTATIDEAIKFHSSCGFLLIAIDNLARINEAYGCDVADEVIAAVGKRLRSRMRGIDLLGRFSGNKFGVVLKTCTPDDIGAAAERLLLCVRDEVVQTRSGPVAVTVSIGGVVAPRHARNAEEAFARAQEALAAAKARRLGSFQRYRPNIERDALRREAMRSGDEIVSALNERRVLIAFEPVVATTTRKLAFHECLMRIRRADDTIVPAQRVIPVAEHLGFVRLIDHRVLELVAAELVSSPNFVASLNVSPSSATDPDWWSALSVMLKRHAGIAQRLTIEITETSAIQDVDDTRGFVTRVKDLGCRIAIDDFGAGYTSFRNLRKLGVDMIKIDGAFIENLTRSEDDRAFVLTLLDLAHRLRLETVAERVQDERAAEVLANNGCTYLQGKLIGLAKLQRPLIARVTAA